MYAHTFSKVLLCPLIEVCIQNGNEFYVYTVGVESDYTILINILFFMVYM